MGMDETCREVLASILERLRKYEKTREEDRSLLLAAVRTIKSLSPEIQSRFNSELAEQRKKSGDPALHLDDVYNGLIRLLKGLDPTETNEQERLRRLLEAFEGPEQ